MYLDTNANSFMHQVVTQKRIEIYRKMTPQQRIEKAIQLTDLTYEVMKDGIRNQHPNLDEAAIQKLVLERMEICRKKGF